MPVVKPYKLFKTDSFQVALFELASNLFFVKVKGSDTTMEDIQGLNSVMKSVLEEPGRQPIDTHFIVDSSELLGVPKVKNALKTLLGEFTYLRTAGYVVTLLTQRNFMVEAFSELFTEFGSRFFGFRLAMVHSPEKAVEFLQNTLHKNNSIWSETTEEKLIEKVKELQSKT